MLQDEKNSVWVLSPAGFISPTTEDRAVQLIYESPGYINYVFFFAELSPPNEIESQVNVSTA